MNDNSKLEKEVNVFGDNINRYILSNRVSTARRDVHEKILQKASKLYDSVIGTPFEEAIPIYNDIFLENYRHTERAYVSGILVEKIQELSLGAHEADIMEKFYESAEKFDFFYDSINDEIQHSANIIKSESAAKLAFGKEYINRWQMYDKLFHDRVRQN